MAILVALLVALAVLALFVAMLQLAPRRDDVGERLESFAGVAAQSAAPQVITRERRLTQRLGASHSAQRFATLLAQADLPLTPGEFLLIIILAGGVCFLLGAWRINTIAGLLFALLGGALPVIWARQARGKRRRAIANQLPDVLTLVVGALRAGYGLAQALDVVAREGPQPSAKEYGRVLRATELGIALPRALDDMAQRVGSDDVNLLVTAINVQYETGGNLSKVLENITQTIRERIRLLREIRTLTAQQRMTGYILAAMPVGLAVVMSMLKPGYLDPFFEPGWVRIMPLAALGMIGIAFILMQWILNIEV